MKPSRSVDLPGRCLAASITRASSRQADFTIRFLVDRERIADAYRAYAYFRWVDDELDDRKTERLERTAFAQRERQLLDCCLRGDWPHAICDEETLLLDLIQGDQEAPSGLQLYLRHMMAVMEIDAQRRGRLISEEELAAYTRHLAIAVTEALHHFIGHSCRSPKGEARYLAASGAHVIHMLRDAPEDISKGYFNIPREYLEARRLDPQDLTAAPCRDWVRARVALARGLFRAGRNYLDQVESLRCRLAGYAYIARFEIILEAIARDGYRLRAAYPESQALASAVRMTGTVLWPALGPRRLPSPPRILPTR
jgi:phytoene/squalene synthetase